MGVINKENSKLIVIATAAIHGEIEDQDRFNYDNSTTVTKVPGGIGYPGTKYITTRYEGAEGSIETNGSEKGNKKLLAYAQHIDESAYVGFHLSNAKELYFVAVGNDDDGNFVRAYFVERARLTREPAQLENGNVSFAFTAAQGMELAKNVEIEGFNGDVTPVTALTLGKTAIADPKGRNVMLVLKDTAAQKGILLKEGTDYTATTTAVTLTVGLAADEKALVVYLDSAS